MKSILFLVLTLLNISFATTHFYKRGAVDHYIVSYKEKQSWILNVIEMKPGKLQELKLKKQFKSQKQLKKFIKYNYKNIRLKKSRRKSTHKYITSELKTEKLWEVENEWTLDWEKSFSEWIKKDFNKDFFKTYNLETDCADVAFALRWIFARMHNLPAASTLAGSHVIFSQDSFKEEWKTLKRSDKWYEDELFLTALNYLLKHVYTGTLNIDGYPIELNKESFLVGTVHLDGGHTMIISDIDYEQKRTSPIWKLSSTVPAQVRELFEEPMMDSQITDKDSGGLFRFRWPYKNNGEWNLTPRVKMPLYSMEQYSDEFLGEQTSFTLALIERLGIDFNPRKIIKETAQTILSSLEDRIDIVERGHDNCQEKDCSIGTFDYEEYSTPTRDGRIASRFETTEQLLMQFSDYDETIKEYWENLISELSITVLDKTRTLKEMSVLLKNKFLSYDPRDSLNKRWAINQSDIHETLNERFSYVLSLRKEKVHLANECLGNKDCTKGSDLWNKHNTYAYDHKLKNGIYKSYLNFCKYYGCTNNLFINKDEMELIPFYSSEPTMPTNYRNGEHSEKYDFLKLPEGENIIQLNSDEFFIDGKVFSTLSKRYELAWPQMIYFSYNSTQKSLVAYNNNKIYIRKNNQSFTYDLSLNESNGIKINWITKKSFNISDCSTDWEPVSGEANYNHICHDYIFSFINNSFSQIYHGREESLTTSSAEELSDLALIKMDEKGSLYIFKNKLVRIDKKIERNFIQNDYLVFTSKDSDSWDFPLKNAELYDFNTQTTCQFTIESNFEFIQGVVKDVFVVEDRKNRHSKIYKKNKNCELDLIGEINTMPVWPFLSGDFITFYENGDSQKLMLYAYGELRVFDNPLADSTFLVDSSVMSLYFNSDKTRIERATLEDIKTGELSKVDTNNIPWPCFNTEVCQMNKKLKTYVYFERDESQSYFFKNSWLKGTFFSSSYELLVQGRSIEPYETRAIQSSGDGHIIETIKGRYIYIK